MCTCTRHVIPLTTPFPCARQTGARRSAPSPAPQPSYGRFSKVNRARAFGRSKLNLIDWTLAAVCAPRPSAPLPPIPITPVFVKKRKQISYGNSGTTTHFDDTTELAHKYLIIGTGSVTNCQYEHMCSYQWLSSDHVTTLRP